MPTSPLDTVSSMGRADVGIGPYGEVMIQKK